MFREERDGCESAEREWAQGDIVEHMAGYRSFSSAGGISSAAGTEDCGTCKVKMITVVDKSSET